MFAALMLMCLFAVGSITASSADKKYNNQSEIIDDMLEYMFSCMDKLKIDPEVCGDLVMKNKDHSDKKYDNCKCFGPCIAKEMGTMNLETGKWNWARLKEMSNLLSDQALINEAKNMEAHCFDDTNTHCEAGYVMMKCALENSQMTKDIVKSYLATKEDPEKTKGDE